MTSIYSERFSGTLHQETAIEEYALCTPLLAAFQSLLYYDYLFKLFIYLLYKFYINHLLLQLLFVNVVMYCFK